MGLEVMPGVAVRLAEARELGLRAAIVSSSPHSWVEGHLARSGLRHFFDALITYENEGAAKPAPDLYLRAMSVLGLEPAQAIAFEDSPNGVASAVAAGLFCVAVPGPMTRPLCFAQADLVLESLLERTLPELFESAIRQSYELGSQSTRSR